MDDWQDRLIEILREYWLFILVGVVGIALVCVGLWGVVKPSENKVEILRQAQDKLIPLFYLISSRLPNRSDTLRLSHTQTSLARQRLAPLLSLRSPARH